MYNNERRFGVAPAMPDPSTKKPDDDSKVAQVSQEIAADTQKPVMEENIKTTEPKNDSSKETPKTDVATEMAKVLNNVGPNIRPVEFRDTVSSKEEPEESGEINVVNVNGMISGAKLVNSLWRTISIALVVVIVVLSAGLAWTFLKYDESNVKYRELSVTNSQAASNLNALYEKLGAETQEEAAFAASFGDTLDGIALSTLKDALVTEFGDFSIDYTKTDFNAVLRVGNYDVVKLVINNKKYVAFAKGDNVWTVVEFIETYHDRCEGYSNEARLVVDKLLSCKED